MSVPLLKSLRALADPTRLRLLALLERDELSVLELQEVTRLRQSRISTHLGLLVGAGLLVSRREGKRVFYRRNGEMAADLRELVALALRGAKAEPGHAADLVNLRRVLHLREDQARLFFNQVAGRFDRSYGPGRSWQAMGQLLLRMLPPVVVADLGSGEGLVSELLAQRCRRVIAVDNSEKIVAFGAAKARKNGIRNLEFRCGDLEDPPIAPESVDVVILSQALHHASDPARALAAAHRVLRPGGQVLVLDLLRHTFTRVRELYGDHWLGFAEGDLERWLELAGFREIEITVVAREEQPPHFETVLAVGQRAGGARTVIGPSSARAGHAGADTPTRLQGENPPGADGERSRRTR
ncbi:MAG TPA: metalloregulator ArsR/SmtB family transcription factor [Verrucomicrobiota bacterium]|nr:metalloregulator ArsR/SmtB family transcription factor [Verrucomicrobiota bacterium]HNU51588.1 metalloregulator ArsR/SmtB family transcription factor [Verrucomicrobiota bacterium]